MHERKFRDEAVKISCPPRRLRDLGGTMAGMSIAGVPGFGVLFPSGSYAGSEPKASTTQNPYQQQLGTLESWQNQILQESLHGNTAAATSALYSSAGLNADQFASLATQLQDLGSIIDAKA